MLVGRESTNVGRLVATPSFDSGRRPGRDRAGAYSDAAQNATPHAQQVADRWHLLVNLHETVERLLRRHIAKLREAAQLTKVSRLSQTQPVQEEAAFPLMAWQKLRLERRSARLARYEEVVRLRAQGLSFKAIGRATELDQRTVKNFVQAGEFPERSPCGSGPMLFDAYRHHLCRRVAEGGTNITTVWHELRAQGFTGSRCTVRLATPSAQRAYAWLVGWDECGKIAAKRAEHRQFCDALCAIEPEIAEASSLVSIGTVKHSGVGLEIGVA